MDVTLGWPTVGRPRRREFQKEHDMEIESNRSYVEGEPRVLPLQPNDPNVQRVVTPVSGGAAYLPVNDVAVAQPVVGQPVVGQPVVAQPVIAQPVVAQPVVQHVVAQPAGVGFAETRRVTRSAIVSPASIVAGIVAILLLILGGITVARAGVDGGIDQPVEVAGFTATALLGFIELGFGAVLLISALSRARESIMFFGILGTVASVIAVFQPTVGNGSLGLERGFAVLMTIAMLIVTFAAFLPTIRSRSSRVERVI
jgi:hypothetical protein